MRKKIIKENNIRFCHEFAQTKAPAADLEDIFTKEEFVRLFVDAFPEHKNLTVAELDADIAQVVEQINRAIGKPRCNHYRPAIKLVQMGVSADFFASTTLDAFERLFAEVNKSF